MAWQRDAPDLTRIAAKAPIIGCSGRFGGVAPTHQIVPGTCLRLWTEDAFSGRLTRAGDRPSAVQDMAEVNPQTGPFHVEGAEPADTLALHIVDLTPARETKIAKGLLPAGVAHGGIHRHLREQSRWSAHGRAGSAGRTSSSTARSPRACSCSR